MIKYLDIYVKINLIKKERKKKKKKDGNPFLNGIYEH